MRYVAWFRALNVGGHNIVKMADLRSFFEGLYDDVATYVQSGNVVFTSAKRPSTATLEAAFTKRFEFSSSIILRDADAIADVIARNPYDATAIDHAKLHVVFAASAPTKQPKPAPPDVFVVDGNEAFVHYRDGAGKTKLKLDLGVPCTARNWRTVLAVRELLQQG